MLLVSVDNSLHLDFYALACMLNLNCHTSKQTKGPMRSAKAQISWAAQSSLCAQ